MITIIDHNKPFAYALARCVYSQCKKVTVLPEREHCDEEEVLTFLKNNASKLWAIFLNLNLTYNKRQKAMDRLGLKLFDRTMLQFPKYQIFLYSIEPLRRLKESEYGYLLRDENLDYFPFQQLPLSLNRLSEVLKYWR